MGIWTDAILAFGWDIDYDELKQWGRAQLKAQRTGTSGSKPSTSSGLSIPSGTSDDEKEASEDEKETSKDEKEAKDSEEEEEEEKEEEADSDDDFDPDVDDIFEFIDDWKTILGPFEVTIDSASPSYDLPRRDHNYFLGVVRGQFTLDQMATLIRLVQEDAFRPLAALAQELGATTTEPQIQAYVNIT